MLTTATTSSLTQSATAIELREATLKATAKIGSGRSATTVVLEAPLTVEAAAVLGCRYAVFDEGGAARPQSFRSSVLALDGKPLDIHLQLDGVAKREIAAENAEPGAFTVLYEEGAPMLHMKLVLRGPLQTQLAMLGFAMEVGDAPLVCSLQRTQEVEGAFAGASPTLYEQVFGRGNAPASA